LQDVEKRKRIEGGFIIAYSSVMAAVELAQSIKSFASQEYAAGAMHLIAMGAYIAAAAKAGSQLGGGSASAPAAATYTPARTENVSDQRAGEARIVNINYSLGRVHAELGQQLERAQWQRARSGLSNPAERGVYYQ
jgi:hypothetical protein